MFTMILSVVVYNHALTTGQWAGAAVVFAGIALEAWVKRKGLLCFLSRKFLTAD
jgi:solute carrier family 35 (UDP-galactose transporter), member B1